MPTELTARQTLSYTAQVIVWTRHSCLSCHHILRYNFLFLRNECHIEAQGNHVRDLMSFQMSECDIKGKPRGSYIYTSFSGYKYKFPFLTSECGIEVQENHVRELYKHIVNVRFPTMGFIGLPSRVIVFSVLNYQVKMICFLFFCFFSFVSSVVGGLVSLQTNTRVFENFLYCVLWSYAG